MWKKLCITLLYIIRRFIGECFSVSGRGKVFQFQEIPIKARKGRKSALVANGGNGCVRSHEQFLRFLDTQNRDILLDRHIHFLVKGFTQMGGVAIRVLRDIVQGKRLAIMRVDVNQSILNDAFVRNNFRRRVRFVVAKENFD